MTTVRLPLRRFTPEEGRRLYEALGLAAREQELPMFRAGSDGVVTWGDGSPLEPDADGMVTVPIARAAK